MADTELNSEINRGVGYVEVIKFETPKDEAEFKTKIESLVKKPVELNLIFPRVLEYRYLLGDKLEFNSGLTSLPQELLDSETYVQHLELRGPMEEIILETNRQRHLNRYPQLIVTGDGWSEHFKQRLEDNLKLEQLPEPNTPVISTTVSALQQSSMHTAQPSVAKVHNIDQLGSNEGFKVQRPGRTRGGLRKENGKVMPASGSS